MPEADPSSTRKLALYLLTFAVAGAIAAAGGELLVRAFVSDETFWPISQIYRPVDAPGVRYLYRPNYDGMAFGVPLHTNGFGFRGGEWSRTPAPGTFRIALVGDSYAFGYGVRFEATLGEQLRALLEERTGRRHEVLNFGINGHNAQQYRAMLEHFALGFAPDLVILMVSSNDHEPALAADDEGWLHWDGAAHNATSRVEDDYRVASSSTSWLARSRLFVYLKLEWKTWWGRLSERALGALRVGEDGAWMAELEPGPVPEERRATFYDPLSSCVELLRREGVPLIIASTEARNVGRRALQALSRDTGTPLVELLAAFPEADNWLAWSSRFGLGWDQHPGAEAHRRFAESLLPAVERVESDPDR